MIQVHRTRIDRVLQILSEVVQGNYDARITDLDTSPDDAFLELEVAANVLIEELQHFRQRSSEQRHAIEAQSERIRLQQSELVAALSTPIIVVAKGVLALPIIGAVSSERAQSMTEAILNRIVAERATHVILDLTAAGDIAAATAKSLSTMAQAVRFIGARSLMTGLGPEMAKTLVEFGFDSSQVVTLPQLADALALLLAGPAIPALKTLTDATSTSQDLRGAHRKNANSNSGI